MYSQKKRCIKKIANGFVYCLNQALIYVGIVPTALFDNNCMNADTFLTNKKEKHKIKRLFYVLLLSAHSS
jgi:hypothetical protein